MKTLKIESFVQTATIIFTSYMLGLVAMVIILQK